MDENLFIAKKLKTVLLFWIILILELALLFLLTYYLLSPEVLQPSKEDLDISILYLSYLLVVISVPSVYGIYKLKKNKITTDQSIEDRLSQYMFTKLIVYAILEFSAVLSLVAYYMNEIKEPLYMFGIVFVIALLNKPTEKQLKSDFINKFDDNAIEEIVYMPDELDQNIDNDKPNDAQEK